MNKILRSLCLLSFLGLLAVAASAEVAFKPGVVDLNKVLDGHYKSEALNVQMEEVIKKVQEQLDQLSKVLQEKGTKFQELVEKSQDTLLKPEARSQAEGEAQKLAEEIQRMQSEAQNFRAKSQEQIQRRVRAHRDGLLEEINVVVNRMAAARGMTMVLDKSISPITGVATVVYSDASYDLTEDVLKEVNKDRPPAPPPAAAPAAPATPAPTSTPAPAATK